jgi:uncharacterized protein
MAQQLALVTGAASGIGFNLAKVFAENGFDVIAVDNDPSIAQIAQQLGASGVQVTPIEADLANFDAIMELWNKIEAVGRPLDAAAINAGLGVGGEFVDTDLQAEVNMVRVNVESTVHLAKHVVQHMVPRRAGRILITSSIAAELVAPREAVYAATKAFDLSFAKSLREELKDTGVTVTALQPGPVDTNFFERAGMSNTQVGQEGKKDNDPYDVAKQGFDALMAGDQHVYAADWKTKLQGAVADFVPDSAKAAMHEKMAQPVSGK